MADAVCFLTGHQGRTATAEGVDDNGVLTAGVANRIGKQVERLGSRMVLILLRLIEVPDGGLASACVLAPVVFAVLKKAVKHGFVLPL